MTEFDVLIRARMIAEEAGVEWRDLTSCLPEQQVARIRDRIARHVLALREEMMRHSTAMQQAA